MAGLHEEPSGLRVPAESIEHAPLLSKYNVLEVPNVILYCADEFSEGGFGVARMSAVTEERIEFAAFCEIHIWVVCTPTGSNPKTAIKQKPATPKARVTSTRENEAVVCKQRFIADKLLHYHQTH
jgi:hypothetical protein